MPLKACAYIKKGMVLFASRHCTLLSSSVACAELVQELVFVVQVSDQRGTCPEEKPAEKGWPVSVTAP